jgi:hypothetical protein
VSGFARGAVVLHGNFGAALVVSPISATAGAVTGTVRGLAKSGAGGSPSNDVWAAVFGQQPNGTAATGGGVYWACDQVGTAGGTYLLKNAGIDTTPDVNGVTDNDRIFNITVDEDSVSTTPRTCPATGSSFTGWAQTYWIALRGGGQVYASLATPDGNVVWTKHNNGLPAGAEVVSIALDCPSGSPTCIAAYAATSAGLYTMTLPLQTGTPDTNTWTLAGLEGKSVRGVALTNHLSTSNAQVVAAVDDNVGVYMRFP